MKKMLNTEKNLENIAGGYTTGSAFGVTNRVKGTLNRPAARKPGMVKVAPKHYPIKAIPQVMHQQVMPHATTNHIMSQDEMFELYKSSGSIPNNLFAKVE